jgi:hypothetical protein
MSPSRRLIFKVLAVVLLVAPMSRAADDQASSPRIDVVLWFDTEDYLLPADDDASKRLADLLSGRGVRATFKIVGEKARTLVKRDRTDVIEALKRHDIAYHSNFHSVHPTITEYLADTGLLDGTDEFVRREGRGADDVRRIFGVDSLSCYGQPGSCWAPQAVAAMGAVGIASARGVPVYVDTGSHIGLENKPFWYARALNVYQMGKNETRYDLHVPQALEPGKRKVSEIAERLRKEGGGLISIFYHPCEWVHVEFWDGVNFARGANPPRSRWKAPRQRPKEETDAAFERFGRYVDHIKSIEGVRFVTARELPDRYPDRVRGGEEIKADDLRELALRITDEKSAGLNFQVFDGRAFSPADQFELLTRAMFKLVVDRAADSPRLWPLGLLGPDAAPPTPGEDLVTIDADAYGLALADVRNFVNRVGRVPARVFIGSTAISPADFLYVTARAYLDPAFKELRIERHPQLLTERHIAKDSPGLYGGWIIHREDFRAPKILEVARLQAWTLKPALREEEGRAAR